MRIVSLCSTQAVCLRPNSISRMGQCSGQITKLLEKTRYVTCLPVSMYLLPLSHLQIDM